MRIGLGVACGGCLVMVAIVVVGVWLLYNYLAVALS